VITVPKRSGGFRTIYVPSAEEKRNLRSLLGHLHRLQGRTCTEVVHGFVRGRSPVTNALAHVGCEYTVSIDLKDFFDHVTEEKLRGKLGKDLLSRVLVDGAARQGLPTSPLVANIAAVDLDKAILKWIRKAGKEIVYTRYADDLALSFNDRSLIPEVIGKVTEIASRCGFPVNRDKVRVQWAGAGRRVITGVAVDRDGVHPTRAAKRRLRAALHQGNKASARGLQEWCALKLPNPSRAKHADAIEEAEALRRFWGLRRVDIEDAVTNKVIQERDLGDDCCITNDPVYFLGMSTFTTGWRSCLSQPGGQYRRCVVAWLALPGTSLAVCLSRDEVEIGGVRRRAMRARCLVHALRDGTLVYDRLYGNPQDVDLLRRRLEEAGFVHVSRAPAGELVVGNIPASLPVYADSLRTERVTLRPSGRKARRFYVP
jgi:hypothetical protein